MNTEPTITRIALIEGYTLYAKALAHIINQDANLEVVGDFSRIDASGFSTCEAHIVLIDLDNHGIDLGESLRLVRRYTPTAQVCVMTQFLKSDVMQRCMALGVDGFFAKDLHPDDFVRALRGIAMGITYVDARLAGSLIRKTATLDANNAADDLSMRELDIIRLIADGLSNKEISARLFLSEKTIKNHTSRIFIKFGVTARTQVAVHALKAGLV